MSHGLIALLSGSPGLTRLLAGSIMQAASDPLRRRLLDSPIVTPRWKSILVVAALAGLTAAFFWRVLFGGQVLYWADLALQFYPWRRFTQQCVLANEIPLWNPYVLCGSPFLANLQSAVLYPLNVLLLAAPTDKGLACHAALHVFLAGAFMFAYLRHVRLSRWASVLGALTYMLSGFMVCRLTFLSMPSVAVWLPLALLFADRCVWRRRAFDVACLAGVTAVQFLGGHLQLSVMLVLAVVALVLARCLALSRSSRRACLGALARPAAAVGLGVLLAMVQLLPTADFVQHSSRAGTAFEDAAIYSLAPRQLTMFLVPDSWGHPALSNYWGEGNYWELCPYFGALGLALAFTGLLCSRRRLRLFFGAVLLGALVLCLGKYTPAYEWIAYKLLPGFRSFKGPARFLFLTTFAGAGLAALGADALLGEPPAGRSGRRAAWPLTALTAVAGVWLALWLLLERQIVHGGAALLGKQLTRLKATVEPTQLPALAEEAYATVLPSLLLTVVVLCAAVLVVRLHRRGLFRRATTGVALGCLIVADLWFFGFRANPTTQARFYQREPEILADLPRGPDAPRLLQRPSVFAEAWGKHVNFMRFGPSDYEHTAGLVDTLTPNVNMWFDLPSVEGYDPIKNEAMVAYLTEAQDRLTANGDTAMLEALNVGRVLTYSAEEHPRRLTQLRRHPSWLYALPQALPRTYVLPDRERWRPGGLPAAAAAAATPVRWGESRIMAYGNNKVSLRATSARRGAVVLADTYDPGWSAFVDGERTELWAAFGVVRGLAIPPGSHAIEFVYLPTSFRLGSFVGLLGLAVLSGLVAAGAVCGRRRQLRGT